MKPNAHTHIRVRKVAPLSICALLILVFAIVALTTYPEYTEEGSVDSGEVTAATNQAHWQALFAKGMSSAQGSVVADEVAADEVAAEEDGVAVDEVTESTESEEVDESEAASEEWKHTLSHTLSIDDKENYTVTVEYNENAGIPDDAEVDVERVDSKDEQRIKKCEEVLQKHLELPEDEQVLGSTFLTIKLLAGGKEVQPKEKIALTIETNNIEPSVSDALEVVPLHSDEAKATELQNLTGKEDNGEEIPDPSQTKVRCMVNELGDFGLSIVVRTKHSWNVEDTKVQLWGPRATQVDIHDESGAGQQIDDLELMATFTMQTDPTHAWVPSLWLSSEPNEEVERSEFGKLLGYKMQDGELGEKLFDGKEETKAMQVASDGTYALLWDDGLHDVNIDVNNAHIEGEVPKQAVAEAEDVTADYKDAMAALDEDGANKYEFDTIAAYDVSFDMDGEDWSPGSEYAMSAKVTDDGITQDRDVEVLRVDAYGVKEPVGEVQVQDGNVSFPVEDAGTYVVVDRVSLEREFVASDNKTYRVVVSYDGSAGLPRDVELKVSEIAEDSAEYKEYVSQSVELLGTKSKSVAYAKALDIALVDAKTGKEYQPTGNVTVQIELLDADVKQDAQLDVIHFGDEAKNTEASVEDNTASFTTDGFSVYVALYTVDFHWGDYTYRISGGSEVLLSEVFEKLGIGNIAIDDVESVSFSNASLVQVEQKSNDWVLKSLAPFTTEEELTLKLKNGETVSITVTDDIVVSGTWPNASSSGTGPNEGTWTIDEAGVMTLSGQGKMTDYNSASDTPWNTYRLSTITKLVVNNGITHLAKNMLTRAYSLEEIDVRNCTTLVDAGGDLFKAKAYGNESGTGHLKRVDFSGCVNFTSFGSNAFLDCKVIEYIDFSNTKIDSGKFATYFPDCKGSLLTLKLNDCANVKTINLSAYTKLTTVELSGCTNNAFTSVTLPTTVKTLKLNGSSNLTSVSNLSACKSLEELDLSGTKVSGKLALSEHTNLKKLTLSNCTRLTELELPESLTELVVDGCTGLTSLKLPESVTALNVDGCTSLTQIYIDGNPSNLPDMSSFGVTLHVNAAMVSEGSPREGSSGVLVLNNSLQSVGVSPESTATNQLETIFAGVNSVVASLSSDSNNVYAYAKCGNDKVASLDYANNAWTYTTEDASTKAVDANMAITLYYYEKNVNLNVRWIEVEPDGSIQEVDSKYVDGTYTVDGDKWYSSAEIIRAYLAGNTQVPDTGAAPGFISKYFYQYLGLGSKNAQNISDLDEAYKNLSSFYVKNSADGLLFSQTAEAEGTIATGINTLFVVYSTDPPAGSALLDVENTANYNLTITDVLVDNTGTKGTGNAIVADERGILSSFDNVFVVGPESKGTFVLLDAAGKQFELSGGYKEADRPNSFEAAAEYHYNGEDGDIDLKGELSYDFGHKIKGRLFENGELASIIFSGEADRDVTVYKQWIDGSKPEDQDASNGIESITVQFFYGDGSYAKIDEEKNRDRPGVTVNTHAQTVTLSKVDGAWPTTGWTITVPESTESIKEVPVPDGYICSTSADTASDTMTVKNTRALCKIVVDEEPILFPSIGEAVTYAVSQNLTDVSVEIILDHVVLASDLIEIPDGYHVTLTTAKLNGKEPYVPPMDKPESTRATVTCAPDLEGSLIENEGTLTLKNIVLDGNAVNAIHTSALIHNKGSLDVGEKSVLQNAENHSEDGLGGAVYSESGEITVSSSSAQLTNNKAKKGGAIYVETGAVTITEGELSNNTASSDGGAIYYAGSDALTITGTLSHNKADGKGGAVYAQSGTVQLGHGNVVLEDNEASYGGAIYVEAASMSLSKESDDDPDPEVALANNRATHEGGAIYIDSGTIEITLGSITNNEAENGAGLFVNTGVAQISGGSITGNSATSGGAVGVGGDSARLYFSDQASVVGNTKAGSTEPSNVYLDQDADTIINANGLAQSANARIGVYVADDIFDSRGDVCCIFGVFTGKNENLGTIQNDRLTSLRGVGNTLSGKVMWSTPIQVEVRYLKSFGGKIPPQNMGDQKYAKNVYYPQAKSVAFSRIGEDLRELWAKASDTSVYAVSLASDAGAFDDYLTKVEWDDDAGEWKYYHKNEVKSIGADAHVILYYSEPTYFSIQNNSRLTLHINGISLPNMPAAVKSYGLVFAKDSQIRADLLPIENEDLILDPQGSVTLMFPGALNQTYNFGGVFTGDEFSPIKVTCTGRTATTLSEDQVRNGFNWSGTTQNKTGGTIEIVFGGAKPVCKIVTNEVSGVEESEIVDKTEASQRDDGKIEYLFSSVGQAWQFVQAHSDHFTKDGLVTATIQMLVDYMWMQTDNLDIPARYSLTFKTADEGVKRYVASDSENRALISRDQLNGNSFFAVKEGGIQTEKDGVTTTSVATFLNIQDLRFDGKSIRGGTDGGAVNTKDCMVDVQNTEFKNFISGNGGALYVEYGRKVKVGNTTHYEFNYLPEGGEEAYDATNAVLNVVDTDFYNCASLTTVGRAGGGAIHTNSRLLVIRGQSDDPCTFENCTAGDQGGAVFHRIDVTVGSNYRVFPYSYDSETRIDYATIEGCQANAAGGVETDANTISMSHCGFENCIALSRNGGGMNVYALQNAENGAPSDTTSNVSLRDCTFKNCSAATNGGGFRSTAYKTVLEDCSFTETTAKNNGGGFSATNSNSIKTALYRCSFEGCITSNAAGGGVYAATKHLRIATTTDDEDKDSSYTAIDSNEATIKNCSALGNGGGICYANTNGKLELENVNEISGNTSSARGGGVYTNAHMTLIDSSILQNRLTTDVAQNAAGVYIENGRTLTVGKYGDADGDSSRIIMNRVAGGVASNLRLSQQGSGNNSTNSVSVQCDLKGDIRVVNAKSKRTQFGSVCNEMGGVKPLGLADTDAVFVADDGSLYGIVDRMDTSNKKIIWAGEPICKITDSDGYQLYLNESCTESAIFDLLDDGKNNGSKNNAFGTLRGNYPLYRKDPQNNTGKRYEGTEYHVEMLVPNYTLDSPVTTPTRPGIEITLTTAGAKGTLPDGTRYWYQGKNNAATITRGGIAENASMVTSKCNFVLTKITLDGGSVQTSANGGILKVSGGEATIEGNGINTKGNVVLRNSTASNGGAVYIDTGTLNLKDGGQIVSNSANTGGGIYNNKGTLNIDGGAIEKCEAQSGAGVFVGAGRTMTMSGGVITSNNATVKGGGIAVGSGNSHIVFSQNAKVEGNTLNRTTRCNVELDFDSVEVIQSEELNDNASIGVYVSPSNTELFEKHGIEGRRFGTHDGTHIEKLYCFVNDVNELKGGTMYDDGGIYWVKVFALEVRKTVVSGEKTDLNKQFRFRVKMWKPDGTTVKGKYGEMSFRNGEALFYLRNGEVKTAENLLPGSEYEVEEILDPNDQTYYGTIPAADDEGHIVRTGTIGENTDSVGSSDAKYVSNAPFINLSAVCKITTSRQEDRKLLYYRNAVGAYLPAVYSSLQLAFDQLWLPDTVVFPGLYELDGSGVFKRYEEDAVNVEMLVPDYSLSSVADFNMVYHPRRKVTLRTADPNAEEYKYRGSEEEGTGTAVISRADKSGASMVYIFGDLTFKDITLDGEGITASDDGGIAQVLNGGKLTIVEGATLRDSSNTRNGGAVYVADGGVLSVTDGEISGNSVTDEGCGGAVYIDAGGTMNLSGGVIKNNTAQEGGTGAGIYIAEASTVNAKLNISGKPDFGEKEEGNLSGDNWQDIYIAGYGYEDDFTPVESLVVAGEITSGDGSIRVWVKESPHYETLKQFAQLAESLLRKNEDGPKALDPAKITTTALESTLKAFRNTQDDDITGVKDLGIEYLYGVSKDDDIENVYWYGISGSRKVILRKIASDTRGLLEGAKFDVFTSATSTSPAKDSHGNVMKDLISRANGVFYVGDLNYGTYYIKETNVPSGYDVDEGAYFIVTVNEHGVGYLDPEGSEDDLEREVEAKVPTQQVAQNG